jgi:hypothetical protein
MIVGIINLIRAMPYGRSGSDERPQVREPA